MHRTIHLAQYDTDRKVTQGHSKWERKNDWDKSSQNKNFNSVEVSWDGRICIIPILLFSDFFLKNVAKMLKVLHFPSVQQTADCMWSRAGKDQEFGIFKVQSYGYLCQRVLMQTIAASYFLTKYRRNIRYENEIQDLDILYIQM